MQIIIGLDGWYDWQPAEAGYEPTEAEILGMAYKASADGSWLKRELVPEVTETQINIPESQITTLMEHFERKGNPKTREQTYAYFIEEHVMIDHAPAFAWKTIQVQADKELKLFLARRFGIE